MTVKSRDGGVNATRENKRWLPPIRKPICNRGSRKSLFEQMTTQKRSSRAQHLLSIKAIRVYLAYKRTDNKAEAGSIGRCGLADIQIIYGQNWTRE